MKENIPLNYGKKNIMKKKFLNHTPFFKDRSLYSSTPLFSIYNKSNYVEVNPYNDKNYDLGNSGL